MKGLAFAMILAQAGLYAAAPLAMDSERGHQVFESHGCIECHKLNGHGGNIGPDLGRMIDRGFTSAVLAGTMWNHAPTMWSAMQARHVERQPLDVQEASDLFAAFYAAHYFDTPADAARGKAVFVTAFCSHCHGIETSPLPAATPVSRWTALSAPIVLVASMWNHAATMQAELEKQKIPWPSLSGQDIADLLVYLRNLPSSRHTTAIFRISSGEEGRNLFDAKACGSCHAVAELRTQGMTLDDVAASFWNHANLLKASRPQIGLEEMRSLLGYVWASQFFQGSGNAARGAKVFVARHCSECHGAAGSGAPDLTADAGSIDGITIVSALWRHGPAMFEQMQRKGIRWPQFKLGEMADLIAYLNAGKRNAR